MHDEAWTVVEEGKEKRTCRDLSSALPQSLC